MWTVEYSFTSCFTLLNRNVPLHLPLHREDLSILFRPKEGKLKRDWRIWHNDESHTLCTSSDITATQMLAHRCWCTLVCERWLVWVLERVPSNLAVSCGFPRFLQGNAFLPNPLRFLTHHQFVLYSLDCIWKAGQYLDNYIQWVSLEIILVNNQYDALFSMYLFPFSTCFMQPSAHHQENLIVSVHHLVYVTLCRWLPGSRQSPTQSDIYQMIYWYNSILLMMNTEFLETCREGK